MVIYIRNGITSEKLMELNGIDRIYKILMGNMCGKYMWPGE